ncbi:glycosyltransferase family 2 protein [bacterium]|nr:MAG: glycosyltransferase family 2 protein [bacterium]
MPNPLISIITPTTGEPSLIKLMDSLYAQSIDFEHIILWDDKRNGHCEPEGICAINGWTKTYNIEIPEKMIQGVATGSALRSIGLMASKGKYVIFADSDVWQDPNHLQNLLDTVKNSQWGFCRRKIWDGKGNYIGIDNFESVGDDKERRVPYLLVDNNTMIFERRFGSSAATLYRETTEYNDDRLMTEFLYKYAGQPGISKEATINQVCPERLEGMFKENCTK